MTNVECPSVKIIKNKRERVKLFISFLNERYPEPRCELIYNDAFQLTAATILSAQCTDKQVNKVTPLLFEKYPTPEKMAQADIRELEEVIRSTGFYKNKAKNLIGMASAVVLHHNSVVPNTMEELTKLPGVGRKTANVVLGNAYRIPGMVVDTHVLRISNRLGFTKNNDPVKVEKDLEKLVPQKGWVDFSHQVILLGRDLCPARKPHCDRCPFCQGEIK